MVINGIYFNNVQFCVKEAILEKREKNINNRITYTIDIITKTTTTTIPNLKGE